MLKIYKKNIFTFSKKLHVFTTFILFLTYSSTANITQSYYNSQGSLIVVFDYRQHNNTSTLRRSLSRYYERQFNHSSNSRERSFLTLVLWDCETYTNRTNNLWDSWTGAKAKALQECQEEKDNVEDELNAFLTLLRQSEQIKTGWNSMENRVLSIPAYIQTAKQELYFIQTQIQQERTKQEDLAQKREAVNSLSQHDRNIQQGLMFLEQYISLNPQTSTNSALEYLYSQIPLLSEQQNSILTIILDHWQSKIDSINVDSQNVLSELKKLVALYSSNPLQPFSENLHQMLDENQFQLQNTINELQYRELTLKEYISLAQDRLTAIRQSSLNMGQYLQMENPELWITMPILNVCYAFQFVSDDDFENTQFICSDSV